MQRSLCCFGRLAVNGADREGATQIIRRWSSTFGAAATKDRPITCSTKSRNRPDRQRYEHRPISLGSIFRSDFDKLKEKAEADRGNVAAQIALYRYLLEQPDPATVSDLVGRFEKQTALFNDSGRTADGIKLLQDEQAWDCYLEALAKVKSENGAGVRLVAALQQRNKVLAEYKQSTFEPQSGESPLIAEKETATQPQLSRAQLASAVLSRGGTQNVKVVGDAAASPETTPPPSNSKQMPPSPSSAAPPVTGKVNEPIRVIVEEAKSNLFLRAVRFLLVVGIYTFISLTILSLVLDGSGLMRASTSKSPAQFQPSSVTKPVTFADVHGCEEAKAELQEVVDFLKDPAKFSTLGGKLPKGVLLTGPPGTGKTLLARAVAGEAGVSFLFASGSEFDELFVGVGAKRVRELFAAARKAAPCIIFIDELDAIGSKRSPRDAQHMRQTLNQLLTELDGFSQSEGVILLGATNLPQLLDKALMRPGRFDRHVAVPLPDVRGRLQILQHHIKSFKVANDVNMIQVARGTVGFSGADLENLINQAAVKASRESSAVVDLPHIEWAKDKILMGAERLSAVITPESRRKTAFHEAGHALVALYTDGAMPLHRVTVVPRGHSLGHTMQLPEMDRDSESFLELRARLDVAMGGRVAEQVVYGKDNITSGASSDIKNATNVANAMVRSYGYSDALGTVDLSEDEKISTETMHMIESEVRTLIDGAQSRAMQVLTDRSEELYRLAEALVTYETLSLEDVEKVVKGEVLQRAIV